MYPYDLILGLDLYEIMIAVGFFLALLYLRFWADRKRFSARLQNLCVIAALFAVIGGYGSAVLFQAFYNYLESGVFALSVGTGATFYGGLVGGALIYLLTYLVGGALFLPKRVAVSHLFELTEIAAGSIAIAHACGRIGCLFAGCCHGAVTNAWYGVYHASLACKTVPVQLFEAIFLFLLALFLTARLMNGKKGNMGFYLVLYAIWRFAVEYMRTDHRGSSPIPFLTPSQFTAVCLLLLGVFLWALEFYLYAKKSAKKLLVEEKSDADENTGA